VFIRLIRYMAEYDAVGLLIRASGPEVALEAVVYGPGSAGTLLVSIASFLLATSMTRC